MEQLNLRIDESVARKTMKEKTDQKYIIRCDRAGVFYANVTSREGSEAVLANARRIYSWRGAATLSQLANEGCSPTSQLTVPVDSMTVLGVIELIPCSEKAVKVLDGIAEWRIA